jgi:hypothetical protein
MSATEVHSDGAASDASPGKIGMKLEAEQAGEELPL